MPLPQCDVRFGRGLIVRDTVFRFEHRPAGVAEDGLLPAQAGRDGPHVRDFAGAEAIDVGRAGLFLLRRGEVGQRRTAGEQRENQTERRREMSAAP